MHDHPPDNQDASGLRIALVVSRYHEAITSALRDGAVERFAEAGGRTDDLEIIPAPGAFELIAITAGVAQRGEVDAIVAIGCVITGETTHDRYLCEALVQGLTRVSLDSGTPVAFGVLTCQTPAQARARAGGRVGNKGIEAMSAAIETANTLRGLRRRAHQPSPERA